MYFLGRGCYLAVNVWSCVPTAQPSREGAQKPFFLLLFFRFVHQKRHTGLLLRAITSQLSARTGIGNSHRVADRESGQKMWSGGVTALYFCLVCVFVCSGSNPPLHSPPFLNPYLEPGWLLQMGSYVRLYCIPSYCIPRPLYINLYIYIY